MNCCYGIQCFNSEKGDIYSYAYRIAYTAALHYYSNIVKEKKKKVAIEQHCQEALDDYMREYSTHKVTTTERH